MSDSSQEKEAMLSRFAILGTWAARWPWWFLAFWVLLVSVASNGARKAPSLLFSGSGDIPASASLRSDSLLRANFNNPYGQLLVLTLRQNLLDADSLQTMIQHLDQALRALPQVSAVTTPDQVLDKRLLPKPGTGAMILIGVKAETVRDAEQAIPIIRGTVDNILAPELKSHRGLKWAVTGRSALTYDLNVFNAKDTAKAELRVIPLTLLILLLAFGSIVAAGIPVILGILSTVISMGIIYLLAGHWVLSNLVQNVSSMIGLAVGIDYSLLIIHRYRESLAHLVKNGNKPDKKIRAKALEESLGTAGKSVFFSGLTVMIGLAGMLFTPLLEIKSIGWGGCIVVCISVAAALTFLPALLTLIGPALEWPKVLSSLINVSGTKRRWINWSHWVMARAPWCVGFGTLMVLLLAWPAKYTRFGFPEGPFIPAELGFSQGYRMLDSMGMQGLVNPLNLILESSNGAALQPERIAKFYDFSQRIRQDQSVARIFGPLDLADDWPLAKYTNFYVDIDAALENIPSVRDFFVSRDGKSILMQVMLKPNVELETAKQLARDIPSWLNMAGMTLTVGGQAVYYNDFDKAMKAAYLPCMVFVLVITLAALLFFFRSPLVAVKALVMNALSVLAGYGVVVFVFQLGHGSSLFGSPGPSLVVPLHIPLMLFCILFGLSMDYEVFLLSRIRECFLATGDNERSVAEGLAATGPMITSAALIMAAVFGAFAFARVVVVQMLGLGLSVSVLVDATIIRILLVPAFMKIAGKWNWWP